MYSGAFLISPDLAAAAVNSGTASGHFIGLKIESEDLFAALSLVAPEPVVGGGASRIVTDISLNRAKGSRAPTLIRWVVIEQNSILKFLFEWIDQSLFRSMIHAESEDTIEECVCLIEKGTNHLYPLVTLTRDNKVHAWLLDSINHAQYPNALERLPVKNIARLQQRTVVIVGVGSGGGEIALNLAAAGVGNLILVDSDRVHPENYFRSVYDRRDLGRTKVAAVADCIAERELPTKTKSEALDIIWQADRFRDLLHGKTDLVVCSTDSVSSRRLVNYCCVKENLPCVMAGLFRSGQIGEIISVRPFQGPCYECTRTSLQFALEQVDDDDAHSYLGLEERTLRSSALRSDVTAVAAFATRAALAMLDPEQFSSLEQPYVLLGREAQPDLAQPFSFIAPLSMKYVRINRDPRCPACGPLRAELMDADITKEVEKIISDANQFAKNSDT